ncbi:MAG: hypothetical protein IKC08_07290, partial [Lentisphaeria bacterium]|nr:hypothetical protein [Lentisphaeria bacterium]
NMNDAAEMRLFMHGICNAVVEKLREEGESEKGLLAELFFQKELKKEFHYSAYAACFSKYRDDAAQWERYGHLGRGVCIAFHEDILQQMIAGSVFLKEVYYQEDMREHRLVDSFINLIKETTDLAEGLPFEVRQSPYGLYKRLACLSARPEILDTAPLRMRIFLSGKY